MMLTPIVTICLILTALLGVAFVTIISLIPLYLDKDTPVSSLYQGSFFFSMKMLDLINILLGSTLLSLTYKATL